MDDITQQLGTLIGAALAGAIAAGIGLLRRKLSRAKKVKGIISAHLPKAFVLPAHKALDELALLVNESLTGQDELPLTDSELEVLRQALKKPRAPTHLPPGQ